MRTAQSRNLYKVMQRFANITKGFIVQGQVKRAEKCLRIADLLFKTGNIIIKNAVANVFVYSLSSMLDRRDACGKVLLDILPFSLRKEYENQVNSIGV